jgi:hypothetical protein
MWCNCQVGYSSGSFISYCQADAKGIQLGIKAEGHFVFSIVPLSVFSLISYSLSCLYGLFIYLLCFLFVWIMVVCSMGLLYLDLVGC